MAARLSHEFALDKVRPRPRGRLWQNQAATAVFVTQDAPETGAGSLGQPNAIALSGEGRGLCKSGYCGILDIVVRMI
jgi:hypothetical protein